MAEELCKQDVVHLVDAFVRICPCLLVKFSTLVEAFRNVNSTHPRSRAGNVLRQARNWACNVKLVLSHWRNLAVYPERHYRSMLEADAENKRTITRLTKSIEPYSVTTRFEETSPTTGGTSQPSKSSPERGQQPRTLARPWTAIQTTSFVVASWNHWTSVCRQPQA